MMNLFYNLRIPRDMRYRFAKNKNEKDSRSVNHNVLRLLIRTDRQGHKVMHGMPGHQLAY